MKIHLFDSELKVMELLWQEGELAAKDIAAALRDSTGWSKTTTYTVIKKCIDKGAVIRTDPGFRCRAALTRAAVQESETAEFIDKFYDGAADQLVACLLSRKALSSEEIDRLRKLVAALD